MGSERREREKTEGLFVRLKLCKLLLYSCLSDLLYIIIIDEKISSPRIFSFLFFSFHFMLVIRKCTRYTMCKFIVTSSFFYYCCTPAIFHFSHPSNISPFIHSCDVCCLLLFYTFFHFSLSLLLRLLLHYISHFISLYSTPASLHSLLFFLSSFATTLLL